MALSLVLVAVAPPSTTIGTVASSFFFGGWTGASSQSLERSTLLFRNSPDFAIPEVRFSQIGEGQEQSL